MACGNGRMLEGFPFVETKSVVYGSEQYERNFFGGLVSTTVPTSTYPAWDSTKTDYQIGDKVSIDALKTDYVCGEVGNREYPPSSSMWEAVTANDYRQIDSIPTTKSVSTADVVNVYDVTYANYIVGHFIDGVDTITIESLDDTLQPTGVVLGTIKMTEIIDYTCFSCCNPPASKKRFFHFALDEKKCSTRFVRVTLTKHVQSSSVSIGTIAPVRAVDAGMPELDTRVEVDNGITFQRTKITKNIHAVNMGATITVSGNAYISADAKKRLHKKIMEYQGITFTLFDIHELEVIEGVIMGKFTMPGGLQIGLDRDTKYQFKKQGVLA